MFFIFFKFYRFCFKLFENFSIITCCHFLITTLNFSFMKFIDSSLLIKCLVGILVFLNLLFLILKPGLSNVIAASRPIIPIFISYSTPGMSIYSLIPKEKFPNLSKLVSFNELPLACTNLFNNVIAFSPRSVTLVAICKPGLRPQVGILSLAVVITGLHPEIVANKALALSNFSPCSPIPMFKVTFSTLIVFIWFIFQQQKHIL